MKKTKYLVAALCLASLNCDMMFAAVKRSTNRTRTVRSTSKKVQTPQTISVAPAVEVKLEDRVLSSQEKQAVNAYLDAYNLYNEGKYKASLSKIARAEALLKTTTPRTAYLKAQCNYQLGEYKDAQTACNDYFANAPRQDNGYGEMTEMSATLKAYFERKQKEVAKEKQEQAALAAQEKLAKERAQQLETANIKAARERRDAAKASFTVKDDMEKQAYADAQKANTKEAYHFFIESYPYGKLRVKAEQEMKRKWPDPIRKVKNNKYGFVDKTGKFVVKAKYDNASDFSYDRARVGISGKYGFVDAKGKVIVPLEYKSVDSYSYGFAAVKTNDGKAYFLDKDGKRLGENEYSDAKTFSEGLAAVANNYYKYGYINTEGTMVISPSFDVAGSFHEGYAVVGKNQGSKILYAYVNQEGELLTDFIYEDAKDFQRGTARIKCSGKYGLIDHFGSPITGCEYDYITDFRSDGYARAKRNNLDVLLDEDGIAWTKVNGIMIQVKFKE